MQGLLFADEISAAMLPTHVFEIKTTFRDQTAPKQLNSES